MLTVRADEYVLPIPVTLEDICDFAYVGSDPTSVSDWTRVHMLLFKTPSYNSHNSEQSKWLYPVKIRMTGFLGPFEVGPLGNWTG